MKNLLLMSLIFFLFSFFSLSVKAQMQDTPFSANDSSCSSYQCFDGSTPTYDSSKKLCMCGDEPAYFKPPTLQQVEIWFVRIVYIVWAFVGSLSFVMLVYLGYQYMLKGGTSDQALVDLRRRIINYIIGVVLVFLAVPILTTFFRFLNINGDVKCYEFAEAGDLTFRFFFPELCTDPLNVLVSDPCTFGDDARGFACAIEGERYLCSQEITEETIFRGYVCRQGVWNYIEFNDSN
ncbi:MAG: hypothetical protein KatS3mg086_158 [Candidatus Dojkabacteria bacterium]|nr:MAG: hypothetical protein KatS3mg086_158 [Candidatus Dojkabacteria bacterium]